VDAEAFINGSEEALGQLMDEMTPALMRYSYGILLNYSDAEDAVQTAFVKAYLGRGSIRDPGTLTAFLYRVTYNASVDIVRKRLFFITESAAGRQDRQFISEEMAAALKKLPALDRALVYGRVVEEMSYTALSAVHGKSEQSLRKRYERAKKKLAKLLRPEQEPEKSATQETQQTLERSGTL